jgi:hypothetical protein
LHPYRGSVLYLTVWVESDPSGSFVGIDPKGTSLRWERQAETEVL